MNKNIYCLHLLTMFVSLKPPNGKLSKKKVTKCVKNCNIFNFEWLENTCPHTATDTLADTHVTCTQKCCSAQLVSTFVQRRLCRAALGHQPLTTPRLVYIAAGEDKDFLLI